jgi:hypothetical protein
MTAESVTRTKPHHNARFARVASLRDAEVLLGREARWIPPGDYDAIGTGRWRRLRVFATDKLSVEFTVFPDGIGQPEGQLTLSRYYNVSFSASRCLVVGPHSDYAREWQRIAGRKARRRDRMSPAVFAHVWVRVAVDTVTVDHRRKALDPTAQYSVIREIIERRAGVRRDHA